MTPALRALQEALRDVDRLIEHHPKAAQPTKGRPTTDEGPLRRSCVLLIYAAWEVYVEDSLIWVVEELTRTTPTDQLPPAVRAFVAEHVKSDPWALAGDGWRAAAVDAVTTKVRGTGASDSFGLNTAGPAQVNALHMQVLGVRILDGCRWQKMPTAAVKTRLAVVVRVRGSIAHTGRTTSAVQLGRVRAWRAFVERLAGQIDARLATWVDANSPHEETNP